MSPTNGKPPFDFGGTFDVTLLADHRLRLPVGVTNQLRAAGIASLRLTILPGHPALVVCPESAWPAWRTKVKATFNDLAPAEAERATEIFTRPIHLDPTHRFYLPGQFREYARIQHRDDLRIIGIDDHFEIWRLDDTEDWSPNIEPNIKG